MLPGSYTQHLTISIITHNKETSGLYTCNTNICLHPAVVVSGYVMNWLGAERWSAGYILGYIFIIFPIYHVLLLAFAFLFGRFDYFFNRIKKLFRILNQKNTGIN